MKLLNDTALGRLVSKITERFSGVEATAADAVSKSEEALSTVDKIEADSSEALSTANTALEKAEQAVTTADEASETAGKADTVAKSLAASITKVTENDAVQDTQIQNLEARLIQEEETRASADTTLQENIDAEASVRSAADTTLQENIDAEASARSAADTTLQENIDSEASERAAADTALQENIDAEASARSAADTAEASARSAADTALQENIDAEASARSSADTALQENIDAEASARSSADTAEASARSAADTALQKNINAEASARSAADTAEANTRSAADTAINAKIPSAASASNQLADKQWVNTQISTAAATYRGTFSSVEALEEYSGDKDSNDYAYVTGTDDNKNETYTRYIYDGTSWAAAYTIPVTNFDTDQWDAINSGATTTNITQIATNTSDISSLNSSKQDMITITEDKTAVSDTTGYLTADTGTNTVKYLLRSFGDVWTYIWGKITAKRVSYRAGSEESSTVTDMSATTDYDDREVAFKNETVSEANGGFRWLGLSALWTYFKQKISDDLGLTSTSYGGKAATAGSADSATTATSATTAGSATKDDSGNTISSTYLKLSGGTMTGALFLPIAGSSEDDTTTQIGNIPASGAMEGDYLLTALTDMTEYKTFIGSAILNSSTWYNVISCRHRNGFGGDGYKYGMMLYSLLTSDASLCYRQQSAGTWYDERVLLDSKNTSFTRSLSEGTKIGAIKINGTSTDIYAPVASKGDKGDAGEDGLSIWRSSYAATTSTTSISTTTITIPSGRSVQVGDLVIANSTYSYMFRVTAVSGTTLTVTYLQSVRGAQGAQGVQGAAGADASSFMTWSNNILYITL